MPLIDHLSLGVSNIEEARSFYDGVMSSLGCDCLAAGEGFATYGQGRVEFLLLHPFDGGAPTAGNGTHIGFTAPSREAVDAFYKIALSSGGTDEGEPGVRDAYLSVVRIIGTKSGVN